MLFNSFEFAIFFAIVFAAYHGLKTRHQNILLLVASYFFYGCWDWRFLILLFISTAVDYYASRLMQASTNPAKKKLLLTLSLCGNLGLLGFFKYYNFFMENLTPVAALAGLDLKPWFLDVILPVGISFYTLQTLGYVIDVYRGGPPCDNLFDFALYVSFFPQLVAGPIERASNLLPQLQRDRTVDYDSLKKGCFLILLGLFQKIVIADNLAVVADRAFATPALHSGADLLIGVYAFAFQIYCDFSGYSIMAIGIAKLLGIDLMENFDTPYLSTSVREFWRRWHISLSTWLRDYLYIPLGGNRSGNLNANLMITMLIGGLWHGANWTMLIWGGFHGICLVANRWIEKSPWKARNLPGPANPILSFAKGVFTFHLVCLAWVFFRATSLSNAIQYLTCLFANWSPSVHRFSLVALCLIGIVLTLDVLRYTAKNAHFHECWAVLSRSLLYASLVAFVIFLGVENAKPFIYFQF